MELREESAGGVIILDVKGRVDSTTAPDFGERLGAILGASQSRLLVDFQQVDYISSAGFRVLLVAAKRAEDSGSRLVLCRLSAKVRQLFDLGGFLDLFSVLPSREEALAALG